MNGRTFNSRALPDNGKAPLPEYPAAAAEPEWLIRERTLLDRVTRYVRMTTWTIALLIAILFFSILVSLSPFHFGNAPPGVGEHLNGQPADPGDAPNTEP